MLSHTSQILYVISAATYSPKAKANIKQILPTYDWL